MNGTYLSKDYLNKDSKLSITFPFEYDDFSFLPNVTVCGHIGVDDSFWDNSSCSIQFDRDNSLVVCECSHMSFYSVVQSNLKRPQLTPLVFLQFQNWPSFAVFLYMILILITGVIYTFNKDNHDYRFLHQHEEQNEGVALQSEDSFTLTALAFKRQVFYMAFS